jgi:hypothetical protein
MTALTAFGGVVAALLAAIIFGVACWVKEGEGRDE